MSECTATIEQNQPPANGPNESENNSEQFSEKPKRGRPPVMPRGFEEEMLKKGFFDPHVTHRTRVNRDYRMEALGVLAAVGGGIVPDRFSWLYDMQTDRIRETIMTELGRLKAPGYIIQAAERICAEKMNTVRAVAWLRKCRQTTKTPDKLNLSNCIIKCVNDYLARHGDTTDEHIERSLRVVLKIIEQRREEPPTGTEGTGNA